MLTKKELEVFSKRVGGRMNSALWVVSHAG
jgi:hypothetical protein